MAVAVLEVTMTMRDAGSGAVMDGAVSAGAKWGWSWA